MIVKMCVGSRLSVLNPVVCSLLKVDAVKMEAFIDHFITNLGLDTAYTMLVINPTWTPSEPIYGYRKVVEFRTLLMPTGLNYVITLII